jgi:uncharacterized membrane protein
MFVRRYRYTLTVLLVGAVMDAFTTYANVAEFGPHVETHPVQRLFFEILGPTLGVPLAKLIQLAFVIFVAARWRPWTRLLLLLCGFLYTLAGLSNHFHWL